MLEIGLTHFLIVSLLLAAAGVASMVTNRNAIGILMGVELLLNAAAVNFVAFNYFAHPTVERQIAVNEAQLRHAGELRRDDPDLSIEAAILRALRTRYPEIVSVEALSVHASRSDGELRLPPGLMRLEDEPNEMRAIIKYPAIDGVIFTLFIIVLAAAEAAVALAIFLNYYRNYSSIDVERAQALQG